MTRVSGLPGLTAGLLWVPWAACMAATPAIPEWSDTPFTRVEALALIETLNAELLASDSATLVLERWCREHALADPPVIAAHRIEAEQPVPGPEIRLDLQLQEGEAVRYRRVELACGERVLSVAENWYVPDRLGEGMNRALEQSQTPFGKVVLPLHPHRRTLAAHMLWLPLPVGWETTPAASPGSLPGRLPIPAALFEHRALLYTSEHGAIAEVHEVYQRDLLAFPEPQWPQR